MELSHRHTFTYSFYDLACKTDIKDVDSFEISDNSLPNEMLEYYRQHPDINIDCVWNIVMPADSKVRYLG